MVYAHIFINFKMIDCNSSMQEKVVKQGTMATTKEISQPDIVAMREYACLHHIFND